MDAYTVSTLLTVTDSLKVKSLQYKVSTTSKFPSAKFDGSVEYPSKITNIKQVQDDTFLHMSVVANFVKSAKKPSQVYLSLKKKSNEKNLHINSYGKLNKETGNYEITLDVTKDMEHLIGDYDMTIHVADYRADKKEVWDIGTIAIWFKQGLTEGNNQGIKSEY